MLFKARPFIALLLILLSAGCAGPHALRHSRAKYSAAVQVTQNEQLLLNLVRLRYRDTPSFLELGSLATQFNFDESVGIAGTIKENSANFNVLGLSAGLEASERPTVSYTPLQGEDFVTKLISPIEEETIVLLTRSGWKGERVFRIAVQSLNGLPNIRKASGPTPRILTQDELDDARRFRQLVQNLEASSERRLVRFNYETVEIPKSTTIPKSALTPQHAVEAAQHGLKIINAHEQVAIAIDKIKSTSPAVASSIDGALLKNVVASVRDNGIPRPIRVKYDPDTGPLGPETKPKPFTVMGDDLLFEAVKVLHEEDSDQFRVVSCDVIDPDEVIVAGTSQKLVMTWHAEDNKQILDLGLPSLTAADEGRYVLQV